MELSNIQVEKSSKNEAFHLKEESLMLCTCSFSRQMMPRVFGFSWTAICYRLFLIKSGIMARKTY